MNAARELLHDLAEIGATIKPAGDRLILRAGSVAIPADLIVRIQHTKAQLLDTLATSPANEWTAQDWQTLFEERAGVLEFDAALPRTTAEARAFEACIVEWLNRNPSPSPAGCCLWCGRFERPSNAVLPFGTDPDTHAWLHAECWPDWQKARRTKAIVALRAINFTPDGPLTNDHDR